MPNKTNFNPRAPCGARLVFCLVCLALSLISTHAPLAGRDQRLHGILQQQCGFQPTRPLRGATRSRMPFPKRKNSFQPTRPLRGATMVIIYIIISGLYFNPRAPCGARLWVLFLLLSMRYFNPRAPCGARRLSSSMIISRHRHFNPRAPCGARLNQIKRKPTRQIFQPTRPLRGATGRAKWYTIPKSVFQPTRPLRGATGYWL